MKKIEYAVGAAGLFIHHLHREGFDRGMIATFGNTYRVEQGFTGTESYLHGSLRNVLQRMPRPGQDGERTRLYDSIEDTVREFYRNGSRNRPWLLTVITDGQDNESSRHKENPSSIGRFVAANYNHDPTNFIFVIGVGSGQEIDERALGILGDAGGFLAMRIGAFPLLEMFFLRIAVQVSSNIAGIRVREGNMTWEVARQILEVSRVPFDYAFLIDRSGTMNDNG